MTVGSFVLSLLVVAQFGINAQPDCASGGRREAGAPRAQVMVLGMFHFVSTQNVMTQRQGDTMTPKRQAELATLVKRLAAFCPTTIAIERPYSPDELERRFQAYLAGTYALSAEETDQIGFRLAKMLGLRHVHSAYAPVTFGLDSLPAYVERTRQDSAYQRALTGPTQLTRELNSILDSGTVIDGLRYMNSSRALDLNHLPYLLVARLGGTGDYFGANMIGGWYTTNLRIYANVARLINSPNDRVLVIYGQGHAKILRQLVADSPDLELSDPLRFLTP